MMRQFGLAAILVGLVASSSSAVLTHHYTFNDGTVNDTAVGGTAHGTLVGTTNGGPSVVAGQLQLNNPNFPPGGVPPNYVSLPPSILPTSGSVTLEMWFTFNPSGFFTEAWTFSDVTNAGPPDADSGQYFMHTISNPQGGPNPPGGGSSIAQSLAGFGGGAESRAYGTTQGLGVAGGGYLDGGVAHMAAAVIDGTAGTLSYYVFRLSDGFGGLQSTIPAIPLSSYVFTDAWLGRSPFPADNGTAGSINEFRVYNEARSAAQILQDFQQGPLGGGPKVTINRDNGAITLTNTAGPVRMFMYSINAPSGSLLTGSIQPISGRVDSAANGGNGTFDNNDAWDVTTNDNFTLIETDRVGEGAEDGASLGTVTLSTGGGWIKSFRQDLTASIQVQDGANFITIPIPVEYTGNLNQAFKRSDLNFDNLINATDWNTFKANHLVPMNQSLTIAQTSALGDLDGDKDVDVADFRTFKNDFIALNGPGAWEALGAVPEPGSLAILAVGGTLALAARRRTRRCSLAPGCVACLAAALAIAPALDAQAVMTHRYTFNNGTANDSGTVGTAHGTLTNGAAISTGGQLALDGVNDYLDLPAATVAINTYPNATFEGWFTINATPGWQRLFDFGNTNAANQGANYIFYSPTSGAGDNRAALTNSDPGGGMEDIADGGAILSAGVQHHVAVVVDQSGANQMSLYINGALATGPGSANPVTLTRNLAGLSNAFAYLGRSTWTADPTLNGFIDEFRIHNNALSAAQVLSSFQAGPELSDILAIDVNTQSGNITIKNTSGTPKSFDYYQIDRAGGKLKPAAGSWLSLDDQNVDAIGAAFGQSWDESGGASINALSELYLRGASTLAAGETRTLGSAFNTALGAGDLKFRFSLSSGELIGGKVNYVTGSADFNADMRVDGRDFLIWQQNFNRSPATLAQGDANGNGTVNTDDYNVWKSGFGSAVAVSADVPEPASGWLAAIVIGAAFGSQRARRR